MEKSEPATGGTRIELCTSAPDRTEMDALLAAYYQLMTDRMKGLGVDLSAKAAMAAAEFWDELDAVLPPKGRLFVARNAEGDLIGCGSLKTIGDGQGELKRLFVKPEARGTGLGRALVERRIEAARAMGLTALLVDTLKPNVEMRGLYAKLGFTETELLPASATYRLAPELAPHMCFFKMDL